MHLGDKMFKFSTNDNDSLHEEQPSLLSTFSELQLLTWYLKGQLFLLFIVLIYYRGALIDEQQDFYCIHLKKKQQSVHNTN